MVMELLNQRAIVCIFYSTYCLVFGMKIGYLRPEESVLAAHYKNTKKLQQQHFSFYSGRG